MADLRKTKAEWERFLARELVGTFLSAMRELQEMEHRFRRQRTQVVVLNDVTAGVGPGGVSLEGVSFGVNTTRGGRVYVWITGVADPRTVSLYRAPGGQGQDLVARGSGPAGTIVPLSERNGSGLSGTWDLPPGVQETTTDLLQLFPVLDWPLRMRRVWDGQLEKDLESQDAFFAALKEVASRLAGARGVLAQALVRYTSSQGSRGAAFLETSTGSLVADSRARDPSGAVARKRVGFLPTLSRAMAEDTLAGEQSVAERVVTASAGVFSPQNRGLGRVLVHQPRDFCVAARWTFRCTRGQDTGHGGREEFSCTAKVSGEDRTFRFGGVRVGQSFSGPEGIGPFTIERVFTKTGDPGVDNFMRARLAQVTGERAFNTEAGVLHWRVEERAGTFDVSFYRSASRAQGDLVAKAEGRIPQTPFQATERNASGLAVNWALGLNPQNGAEGTLDCNFFRVENRAGVPDEFVLTTEVQSEGLIQRLLAEQLGGTLHSKPAGQETISDDYLRAGVLLP